MAPAPVPRTTGTHLWPAATAAKPARGSQAASSGGSKQESAASGGAKSDSRGGTSGAEPDDLKSREYKDADGNIHHHTRAYQEQHKGE